MSTTRRCVAHAITYCLLLGPLSAGCDAPVSGDLDEVDLGVDTDTDTESDGDPASLPDATPEPASPRGADALAATTEPTAAAADCCTAQTSPGCGDVVVESCICDFDPYCCVVAWDGLCVYEVEAASCGVCDAPAGAIDLAITDLVAPSTAAPGEDIGPAMVLEVSNVGTADATSGSFVAWFLSEDDVLDGGDRLLIGGRDSVSALAAGASFDVAIAVNQIPSDATSEDRYIIVVVDEFDAIDEHDELNNVMAIPIAIEPTCGNVVIEPGEDCDGANLGGEACVSLGFDEGLLSCDGTCNFDVSACITWVCGNGIIEGPESCDTADLYGETCVSQGFDGGVLACDLGTCTFDTSGCW